MDTNNNIKLTEKEKKCKHEWDLIGWCCYLCQAKYDDVWKFVKKSYSVIRVHPN